MLYIRKLFTQDLRDGKQIAFPKEPSYSFFSFDYLNQEQDRTVSFVFRARFEQFEEFEGKTITSRLYAAGSESRMDGEVKAFIRDELNAQVDDLLIFKNKGTKFTDFEVMFVPKNSYYYPLLLNLCGGENHSIYYFYDNDDQKDDANTSKSRQCIYYGAPGTGKSYEINRRTKNKEVIRTTFHPDSDYSTFVGAYKPTSIEVPVRDVTGKVIVENGKQVTENRIVYEFVEQAFLQAYTKAWYAYANKAEGENVEEQYLVIEEINRGNCAQIFGDLFQLLDRNGAGFSDYPISADKDMKKQLAKAFKGLTIADAERINAIYEKDIVAQVLSGDVLLLPDNLYIWATMNTSDQSLFPIDSAFKRRWDWKYIPISEGKTETGEKIGYKIKVYGKKYDWWQFLQKINDEIGELTKSEDKKLGYFFCKANNGIIDAETFVSKVIFYLWNDVFKDQDLGTIFNDEEEGELTFNKFYKVDDFGKPMVKEDKVEVFLKNLGLEEVEESTEDMQGDDMDSDQPNTTKDANNRLHVTFPDGETIRIQTSKEYIDILEKIGLDKVYEVAKSKNPSILKCAFVTKEKEDAIENSNYLRYETIGEYHVVRGMSGDTMRPFLEKISNQYNLGLQFYRQ